MTRVSHGIRKTTWPGPKPKGPSDAPPTRRPCASLSPGPRCSGTDRHRPPGPGSAPSGNETQKGNPYSQPPAPRKQLMAASLQFRVNSTSVRFRWFPAWCPARVGFTEVLQLPRRRTQSEGASAEATVTEQERSRALRAETVRMMTESIAEDHTKISVLLFLRKRRRI